MSPDVDTAESGPVTATTPPVVDIHSNDNSTSPEPDTTQYSQVAASAPPLAMLFERSASDFSVDADTPPEPTEAVTPSAPVLQESEEHDAARFDRSPSEESLPQLASGSPILRGEIAAEQMSESSTTVEPAISARPRGIDGWSMFCDNAVDLDSVEANAFRDFLARIHGGSGYAPAAEFDGEASRTHLIDRVDHLLDAMEASPELTALCYNIAQESTTDCSDRVTLTLNDMETARLAEAARIGRYSEDDLLRIGRGMRRLDALEPIIQASIASQQARFVKVDPVEIRLAYQTALADRLELPGVARAMRHLSSARLSIDEVNKAGDAILRSERGTEVIDFLARWQPWQEAMKRRHPDRFTECEQAIEKIRELYAQLPDQISSQGQVALYEKAQHQIEEALTNFTVNSTVEFMGTLPDASLLA